MILAILTVSEAAGRLGISRQAVEKAVHSADSGLRGVQIGHRLYILADSLADYRPNRYPKGGKNA